MKHIKHVLIEDGVELPRGIAGGFICCIAVIMGFFMTVKEIGLVNTIKAHRNIIHSKKKEGS